MDKKAELDYIIEFARTYADDLDVKIVREQLRALWTAYCLHHRLDCDTGPYDSDISNVWFASVEPSASAFDDSDDFHSFDSFDLYMGALLC